MVLAGALVVAFAPVTAAGEKIIFDESVRENWAEHCASCHGADGKGRTRAGRTARVKDFTDAEYQKTFTDEEAMARVRTGITDDNGRERMKPVPEDKVSDAELVVLMAYIRAMAP